MKNCIIVHGCPSIKEKVIDIEKRTYDKHWIPWIRNKLEEKGFRVEVPLMPEPWSPKYIVWKKIFDELDINEETVLVGHSCGGGFLVRWLGDTGKRIRKLILVAPAISHSGNYKSLSNLLNFKIDTSIINNVSKAVIFVSNDDSKGILKSVNLFSEALNIKVIEFRDKGHFTLGDMGTEEFPELLEEVLR